LLIDGNAIAAGKRRMVSRERCVWFYVQIEALIFSLTPRAGYE